MENAGFVVGGLRFARPPRTDNEFEYLLAEVANKLLEKLNNTQDIYWFVIEQYDIFISYGDEVTSQVNFPFSLYEIEYEGRKSENSYVGKRNPGISFLDTQYMDIMSQHYGRIIAAKGRSVMFALFCATNKQTINKLRLQYAVHYHNNCITSGSFLFAEKWSEVIDSLEQEMI